LTADGIDESTFYRRDSECESWNEIRESFRSQAFWLARFLAESEAWNRRVRRPEYIQEPKELDTLTHGTHR